MNTTNNTYKFIANKSSNEVCVSFIIKYKSIVSHQNQQTSQFQNQKQQLVK